MSLADDLDRLLGQSLLPPLACPAGTFPYVIGRARQARGWTRTKAAAECGTSTPSWSNWERGVFGPKIEVVVRMAEVFGWDDAQLGAAVRLCAAFPWKTQAEYRQSTRLDGSPRRSHKRRFQEATHAPA